MSNEYSTITFHRDTYNVTVFGCNEDIIDEDSEHTLDDELRNDNELHDIFDDDHPWDFLHERSFRNYPEIWLYGYNGLGYDET
tara:strand:- start:126 stop:374 length:249 start_codon:yes stop_codon:yes gene_type:complete